MGTVRNHGGDPGRAGDPAEAMLGALLDRAHYAVPAEMPDVVAQVAAAGGLRDAVVYLADYEQQYLLPLAGHGVPEREPLSVDQTLAGRAYRAAECLTTEGDGEVRAWLPLLDGTARIGVMETLVDEYDRETARRCRQYSSLVATLLVAKDLYTDAFPKARRRKPLSLGAEMQWELLPPLTFSDGRVTVSGALEPSYRIAGDTFDYALNDGTAHIAIIDAMGHGFEAAIMASVAVNVYRHSRRHGHDLVETCEAMNDAVSGHFGEDRFATAQLATLEAETGRLRWINAGHPPPWVIRGTNVVGTLTCAPTLPLGIGGGVEDVGEFVLEPGDRLLFLSDGVLEARSASGEFFGEGPLPEFLQRAIATQLPAPEILRRLVRAVVDHHSGELEDDATTVLLGWNGRVREDPYAA